MYTYFANFIELLTKTLPNFFLFNKEFPNFVKLIISKDLITNTKYVENCNIRN